MKEWFEQWFDSRYYHLLYQHRNDDEACAFVDTLVRKLQLAPNASILELACGKGRHARAFAKNNLDVTGLDLSPQSISHAAEFESDKLHFYVHDMRHFFRSNYFDVVTNLFTSFGYFRSEHDHVLAARSIVSALKPNGQFVIDFVNRSYARRNIERHPHEVIHHGAVTFTIQRSYTQEKLLKEIRIDDNGETQTFKEEVNSFSLKKMKSLFVNAGLTFTASYGDYALSDYNEEESPRMILFFIK